MLRQKMALNFAESMSSWIEMRTRRRHRWNNCMLATLVTSVSYAQKSASVGSWYRLSFFTETTSSFQHIFLAPFHILFRFVFVTVWQFGPVRRCVSQCVQIIMPSRAISYCRPAHALIFNTSNRIALITEHGARHPLFWIFEMSRELIWWCVNNHKYKLIKYLITGWKM